MTNTGNDTAKYFTKEELRKKVFILGEEGQCEFLAKLQRRGFSYDGKKNPEHSHSSLDGVIGQSSHDIVYSLPENFHFEETIKSPSQQPFSSPPTAATWITSNAKQMVLSGSISKKINNSPPHPFSSPPTEAKWITTNDKQRVMIDSQSKKTNKSPPHPFSSPPTEAKWITTKGNPMVMSLSKSKKSDFSDDKENRENNEKSKPAKIKIIGEKSVGKMHQRRDFRSSTSSTLVAKHLSKVTSIRRAGRKEHAVRLLMDLLEDQSVNLSESDVSKVHDLMAEITSELKWLESENMP